MAAAVNGGGRLYENYQPVQVDNPQILSLQHRVNGLMQRLRAEEGLLSGCDTLTISDLKDELDFTIGQRNNLLNRVLELSVAIRDANEAVRASEECLCRSIKLQRNVTAGGG